MPSAPPDTIVPRPRPARSTRVGVIVPVHGVAPHLAEALESALSQVPAPAAVVVVDDGSPEPIQVDPSHARHCLLARRGQRGGPAAARATGLSRLDTALIALLDADDVWPAGKLAEQLGGLDRHPEVAVAFGRAVVIGPDGSPTAHRLHEAPAGVLDGGRLGSLLYERNPIPTSSALLRREPLEAAGGFAGGLAGDWDWDLWLRLAGRGESFLCQPEVVIGYRRHPGSLSSDLAAVAELALEVQARHPHFADERTRDRVRRDYLVLLARGRVRQRRYADARASLDDAAEADPLAARERLLRLALRIPGLRAGLGRRDPHTR